MRPNYIVIGSAKSGTTSVRTLLGTHPDVFMCRDECNFFAADEYYDRGVSWYESLFDEAGDKPVRGEGSPTYTFRTVFPRTASRMAKYDPALKLIYIVRDPLERIESAWIEMRTWEKGGVHHSFDTAVRVNRDWLVDPSAYWSEIDRYRDHFPDEQILVLFFEEFKSSPEGVARRCLEFVGADPDVPVDLSTKHLNRSVDKRFPRRFFKAAKRMPLFDQLKQVLPEQLRGVIKNRLCIQTSVERPEWRPGTRRWVLDEIGPDVSKFLQFYKKPADYWRLEA